MALGQTVRAMLYAVSPIDPVTLAAGVAVLLTIAGVAAYVPARHAAMVDAVRALRDWRFGDVPWTGTGCWGRGSSPPRLFGVGAGIRVSDAGRRCNRPGTTPDAGVT